MRMQYLLNIVVLIFLWVITAFAQIPNEVSKKDNSCHERGAKILILGTYHFENPGLDTVNIRADDVLADRRQREISLVLDKLAVYKPTKIAIESSYTSTLWQTRYKEYLVGKYKLGRNEIEQLGFQLAKRLNLPTLYPIDYPMFMSGLIASEIEHKKSPVAATKPEVEKPSEPSQMTASDKKFLDTPIIEHFLNMNTEESIDRSHEQYMTMLLPNFENPAIYDKSDRVANWYKRNLRMFSNLNRITDFNGNDRVLLIVGAGHLKILNSFAIDSPQFCFVEPATYLASSD